MPKLITKTPLQVHRDLLASGIFDRVTQNSLALALGVNQGTVSRIANGNFKRVNRTVIALCKYAKVSTVHTPRTEGLRALLASVQGVNDPEKRKLADIIKLAVDLLEGP